MIRLQYFEPEDFERLIEWSKNEAFLLQWAGPQFTYPLTSEQLKGYLNGTNDVATSNQFIYKVVEEHTNQVVGHISLGNVDRYNRSGRIGKVLLSEECRGKGYGSQMIHSILQLGFDEFKLHRISLGVFDFNTSAIRCYEGAGFVQEGFIRDARRYKDTFWNLIEMGILEDDWRHTSSKFGS